MKYTKNYLTNNECYICGYSLSPKGLMVHSVGVNQPSAEVFARSWDVYKPGGREICVHGFIDPDNFIQTLPFNYRGWHCAGSGNQTHIGIEICEPSTIKYTGVAAYYNDNDPAASEDYVRRAFLTAAKVFAVLCNIYGFDPYKDIISHCMGGKTGIASSHVDPEHLWNNYNITLDDFKNKVNELMPYVGTDLERIDATMGANGYVDKTVGTEISGQTEKFNCEGEYITVGPFFDKEDAAEFFGHMLEKNHPFEPRMIRFGGHTATIFHSKDIYSAADVDDVINIISKFLEYVDDIRIGVLSLPITYDATAIEEEPAAPNRTFQKGDLVELVPYATTYDGNNISSWVFNMRWYIDSINGNRAVINNDESKSYTIMTPINTANLKLVKAVDSK